MIHTRFFVELFLLYIQTFSGGFGKDSNFLDIKANHELGSDHNPITVEVGELGDTTKTT